MHESSENDPREQSDTERAHIQPPTPDGAPAPAGPPAMGKGGGRASERTAPRARARAVRGTVYSVHYELSYLLLNPESGPRGAIVLLHDLPGGAFSWSEVLPALAATGRAVYAFDMLGYGQSARPWPSDTSIWGHADVLLYALRRLRLSEIVLVGFGIGGGVVQILATRLFLGGVAKLVLLDSYAYDYAFAPNWPMPDMAAHQDPEAAHHAQLDQVLGDLRATLPLASARAGGLSAARVADYVDEWNSEIGKHLLYQHIRLLLPSYQNSPASDLHHVRFPVLLLWGQQDSVTPVSLGERMAHEIPGAQLQFIAGAAHLVLDDAPQAVGKAIADFAGPLG